MEKESSALNNLLAGCFLAILAFSAGLFVGRTYFAPQEPQLSEWIAGQVIHLQELEQNKLAKQALELINSAESGRGFGAVAGRDMVYMSLNGTYYHRYNCAQVREIPVPYLIWLSPEEARSHQYQPCPHCRP